MIKGVDDKVKASGDSRKNCALISPLFIAIDLTALYCYLESRSTLDVWSANCIWLYVSSHGAFDCIVKVVLHKLVLEYPHTRYVMVLAYMPRKGNIVNIASENGSASAPALWLF